MRKTILACCFIATLSLGTLAQSATIKIDVDRVIADIDPKIYGVFMEPIHFNGRRMGLPDTVNFNTLYGTLYDPKSPLADGDGFRKDYIDAMRELKITNMRWPGGNFLMGYDWKDGIGPKEQRPMRINLATLTVTIFWRLSVLINNHSMGRFQILLKYPETSCSTLFRRIHSRK